MSIPISVVLERNHALQDVSDICREYGEDVTIYIRYESDVTRDKYNSLKQTSFAVAPVKHELKANPVDHTPNKQTMEKAGIREDCQCIIYFSTKDLIDRELNFDTIENEKITIIIDGNEYGIRDKGKAVSYADAHLYTTIGLFKK